MGAPNKALKVWLDTASTEEARQLAKAARTSVAQLRHYAHGRRQPSAAAAQRIAHASRAFNPLLRLDQRQLCAACGACPYANMVAK